MSRTIALVPAKRHSTGIPGKNWRSIAGGPSPAVRAQVVALEVGFDCIIVSTDGHEYAVNTTNGPSRVEWRVTSVHSDTSAMIEVVRDALAAYPGEPDDIICLLQPTQPLREPKHVTAAIEKLRETAADSVVSVVELPLTHSPDFALHLGREGELVPSMEHYCDRLGRLPSRRQDVSRAYIRDGTVYAFWRKTVERFGEIYGRDVRALIIPASETCALDTPADWAEAERRLRAREVVHV